MLLTEADEAQLAYIQSVVEASIRASKEYEHCNEQVATAIATKLTAKIQTLPQAVIDQMMEIYEANAGDPDEVLLQLNYLLHEFHRQWESPWAKLERALTGNGDRVRWGEFALCLAVPLALMLGGWGVMNWSAFWQQSTSEAVGITRGQ